MTNVVALNQHQKAMFEELGIQRDQTDQNDTQQLLKILQSYLTYPSDKLAQIHREACRLGEYDQAEKRKQMKSEFMTTGSNFLICQCCCCIQQNEISLKAQISTIQTVGQSITLFFSDIKYTAVWCLLSFLLFGIFAISTNILSYKYYGENNFDQCVRSRCILTMISLGSKLQYQGFKKVDTFYMWETWVRMFLAIIWSIFFICKSKTQKSMSVEQELRNVTASDFSIIIKNLPSQYNEQTLQKQLDIYANHASHMFQGRFLQTGDKYDMKLSIANFNQCEPYFDVMKELQAHKNSPSEKFINERYLYLKQWIYFRQNNKEFPLSKQQRQLVYCEIDTKQLELTEEVKELVNNCMTRVQLEKRSRPVIITFHHNYAKQNILNLNNLPWISKIWRNFAQRPYSLNIPGITIQQAPQPEDIIWENIGTPLRTIICRKLLTYFITIIVLMISCIGLYMLSLLQMYSDAWQLSIFISIFVSIFNQILIQMIYYLSRYQKNTTNTMFETSVAHKAVIAQVINSIIINIFVNIMTKKHFGKGGLAEDVFFLSITSAILPPITRACGFGDLWRWAKRIWYSFPRNKLEFESQKDYNLVWQKADFEVGYCYVFIIKTIIFTAFFLSLQPIISLISCIGIVMMYYAEKYYMLKRCRRPKSQYSSINSDMNSLMRLSIVSFALGNLFFNHLIPETYYRPKQDYPDFGNLAVGLILYCIPLTFILHKFQQIPQPLGLLYANEKILLPSQYERTNPMTRQRGIQKFGQYISDLKSKYTQNNKNFVEMISFVVDENKSNPLQAVCTIKASIKAHQGSRRRKNSSLSGIQQQYSPQSKFLEVQSQIMSEKQSISPNISLLAPQNQGALSQTIKLSSVRDQSSLNNSLLNDLVKPKEAQKPSPIKSPMNIFHLIHSIMQIQDDDDFKLNKQQSSSSPFQKRQSVNMFVQSYEPTTSPFGKKATKN